MSNNFVHLHIHSEYSLLDGAARIDDLLAQAKKYDMPALALTDHGVMYGAVEFYEKANKCGVKPIIGCEVYVAPRSRFEKSSRKEDAPYHLLLLAENNQGYRNLMELSSLGFLEGFYYKPRVDKELLKKHSQGLIASSACVKGEVFQLALAGRKEEAEKAALEYQAIFGQDNFFLEIQNQNLASQDEINQILEEISQVTGIPLVATNDIHYTYRADYTAHDALLCIQTGSTLEEEKRLKFGSDQFYLKSYDEMKRALPKFSSAIDNTLSIAERCNVQLDFDQIYLPHYETPEGLSLDSYLEKLCHEGLKSKYPNDSRVALKRLDYELEMIKKTGFSGYFLIVWDFVKFAKENGIKVGPGRGSVAGSIVAYVLDITSVDPLEHGLFFERFLNPERVSMPDIDIDFDDERRDEVINYVASKYGEDRVAQIVTFGTMKARAAIRDAGRVLNVPYGRVDKIAKLIPAIPGVKTTIDDALKSAPELAQEYEADEQIRQVVDTAKALEGLARHDSVHAAGVVISRDKLTNYTPLQRKGEGEIVTQYPMEAIERIGLLKMDFLGLRTLTVIGDTIKIVKRTRGIGIDIDDIPFNDEKTYKMLQRAESIGVFQLESTGMRGLLKELAPNDFEDIVNLLALYRPGPLDSGMVADFVDRRHGRKPVSYLHPSLEPVLKSTYGTIVYQEQVMQIAVAMAGFSMGQADILRKAMAKPNPQVFAQQRERFVEGAGKKEINSTKAGEVFDLVAHFAGYGFNKSHSTGYAMIAYQTAYLKANYPVEFMAALLTSEMGNQDKIAQHVNECRRMQIEVLPPDVNESFHGFTAVESHTSPGKQAIRFGLSAVRNVGDAAIGSIVKSRKEKGEFKSIYDFCERVDLSAINKRALESLIKSGAFSSLEVSRKHLLSIYDLAVDAALKKQKDKAAGQFTFFDLAQSKENKEMYLGQDTEEAKEEFPKDELLTYEKETLGLYVSDHPLWGLEQSLRAKTNISLGGLKEEKDGSVLWVGGIITRISRITTKKGDLMLFANLEDLEGSVEVVVFPSIYQKNHHIFEEDKVVRVKGRLDVKEEDVKVIAQEAELLSGSQDVEETEKKDKNSDIYIRLAEEKLSPKTFARLKEVLATHPGSSVVWLLLQGKEKTTTLRLGQEFAVNAGGGLFAELKELLGEGAISQ